MIILSILAIPNGTCILGPSVKPLGVHGRNVKFSAEKRKIH